MTKKPDLNYARRGGGYGGGMGAGGSVGQTIPLTSTTLRKKYLRQASCTEVAAILESAFDEDDSTGGRFDAIGFDQFCPEDEPQHIREAWLDYDAYRAELEQLQ